MKKIICKKEYDTEASVIVKKLTSGEFGDPKGYEETLYVNGGADSVHPKEDIKRMSKKVAEEWLAEH